MKAFWIVLALLVGSLGVFWMIDKKQRADRKEAYARKDIERQHEEERLAKQRDEEARHRKERMELLAKEDAVRTLQRYIDRQEIALKDEIEECKIMLEMLSVDVRSLDDELAALEKEEERKATEAQKRNIKRRDKVDRVEALLASPTLTRLAHSYLGESLYAIRAEFSSHVGNLMKLTEEKRRRYNESRTKYQKSVVGTDKEVDRLTKEASQQLEEYEGKRVANLKYLRDTVSKLQKERYKLEQKARHTNLYQHEKRRLETVLSELGTYEAQLSAAETTTSLGAATKTLHKVDIAEAAARRTHDAAINARMDDDNATEREINEEIAIFNVAKSYEERTLDRIRDAMKQRGATLFEKQAIAKKKLKYLGNVAVNFDILNADEVEQLRKTISKELSDGVTVKIGD